MGDSNRGQLSEREARRLDARAALAIATGTALIVAVVVPGPMTASLAPRIDRDFAFADVTVGLVIAVFYACAAAASPIAGRLVERAGPDLTIRLAGATIAAVCLAIAAFAESGAAIAGLLLVGSLPHALAGPAVSAMLRGEVPARRQGLAFGAQQSGASLAGLAAGLALPALAIPLGLRSAFVAAAILALAAAALAPRAGPPSGREVDRRPRTGEPGSVRALAVVAALASAAAFGTVSFLVLFAVRSGIDEAAAGLLLAAMGLASTLGRLAFGAISDRPGRDPLAPVALVIAIGVRVTPCSPRAPSRRSSAGRCSPAASAGRGRARSPTLSSSAARTPPRRRWARCSRASCSATPPARW